MLWMDILQVLIEKFESPYTAYAVRPVKMFDAGILRNAQFIIIPTDFRILKIHQFIYRNLIPMTRT